MCISNPTSADTLTIPVEEFGVLKSPNRDWFMRLPDAVDTALSRRAAAPAPHVRRKASLAPIEALPNTPVPVNATLRPE